MTATLLEYLHDKMMMARAFFGDLRCRILRAYETGKVSLRELVERFGVSWEYARKIRKQHGTGSATDDMQPSARPS